MATIVFDAITSSSPAPTHPEDEGRALAIVPYQLPMAADECDDPETEVEFVPLRVVMPEDEQQQNRPRGRVKVRANKPKTEKVKRTLLVDSQSDESDKDDDFAPTRKRGRPARANSAKSETWRKSEFGYSDNNNISSGESESEGNNDDDYDPMGKRGRLARGKSAKSDSIFVFNISSSESGSESESESEGNKDDDYDPTAPDADGHLKKYARSRGRPARAKSGKIKMCHKQEFVYSDNRNSSSSSERESDGNKDDDYDPTAPDADGHQKKYARSRGRPARTKSGKRKMSCKQEFVYSDNSNSSESKSNRNKDDDYDPTASDADGHRQNCATLQDRRGSAFEIALEIEKKLPREDASFVKRMQPSHVERVFWLGLPRSFCKKHLPDKDTVMTLEDEKGQSFHAKYLVARDGLSGGWKNFAAKHSLKVDDALVFRRVSKEKLKVYIVRENEFMTTDDDDDINSKEEDSTGDRVSSPTDNDNSNNDPTANDDRPPLAVELESVEKMRALQSKMAAIKDALKGLNGEADELESSAKKTAQAVRRLVTTPW